MELSKMDEPKKERKSLGLLVPNINKENPKSYDLKGTLNLPEELGGKNIRVGYYWVHRLEELELNDAATSFDPANLE